MDLDGYSVLTALVESLQAPLPWQYQDFPWYILVWLFYFITVLLSFSLGPGQFLVLLAYDALSLFILTRIAGK